MINLGQLKRALGVTDHSSDTLLVQILARAIRWVEEQTGRRFDVPASRIEYQKGNGTDTLLLDGHIADADAVVTVSARRPGADAEPFLDFEVRGDSLVRLDGFCWSPRLEYSISYEDGYDDPPEDIQGLVVGVARQEWQNVAGDTDLTSETIGDYRYTRSESAAAASINLSDTETRTLNRWRRQP
jgi:hypothetical protein